MVGIEVDKIASNSVFCCTASCWDARIRKDQKNRREKPDALRLHCFPSVIKLVQIVQTARRKLKVICDVKTVRGRGLGMHREQEKDG